MWNTFAINYLHRTEVTFLGQNFYFFQPFPEPLVLIVPPIPAAVPDKARLLHSHRLFYVDLLGVCRSPNGHFLSPILSQGCIFGKNSSAKVQGYIFPLKSLAKGLLLMINPNQLVFGGKIIICFRKREYLGLNSSKSCKNGLMIRQRSLAKVMSSTKFSLAKGIWSKIWAAHPCQKIFQVPPGGHDSLDMVYDWLGVITSVTTWFKIKLGDSSPELLARLTSGNSYSSEATDSPMHSLNGRPAVSAVQGDCESVLAEAEGQLCRMLPGKTQQHQGMQTSQLCKSKLGTAAENGERSQAGATKYSKVFLYKMFNVIPKYSLEK